VPLKGIFYKKGEDEEKVQKPRKRKRRGTLEFLIHQKIWTVNIKDHMV